MYPPLASQLPRAIKLVATPKKEASMIIFSNDLPLLPKQDELDALSHYEEEDFETAAALRQYQQQEDPMVLSMIQHLRRH